MEKIYISSLKILLHGNKNVVAYGIFNSYTYTILGRILLFFMGIPKVESGKGKVVLEIENRTEGKIWKRYFNNKLFKTYSNHGEHIFIEKQGPVSFEFLIEGDDARVEYKFRSMKIIGIRIPERLSLRPYGISILQDSVSWTFDIGIHFLFDRPLVVYKGYASLL